MRIVLMMEGLEGPNTQDKAERFMVATGHYLEDVMATCHPTGVGRFALSSNTTLEEIR